MAQPHLTSPHTPQLHAGTAAHHSTSHGSNGTITFQSGGLAGAGALSWARRGQHLAGGSQLVRRSTRRCPVVASCTRPAGPGAVLGVWWGSAAPDSCCLAGGAISLRNSSCNFSAARGGRERRRGAPPCSAPACASASQPRLNLSPLQPAVGGTAQAAASAAVSALLVLLLLLLGLQ